MGNAVSSTIIAELIVRARNTRSQSEFAREIGVSQGTLSKYERGRVNPPVRVIEHCIRLVNSSADNAPTADELADKVRRNLAEAEDAHLRLAISKFIDGLTGKALQSIGVNRV